MNKSRVFGLYETKQDRVNKLAKCLAQTDRLRHIWLAGAPPHYPSVYAARRVELLLKDQIRQVYLKRREAQVIPDPSGTLNMPNSIPKLLNRTPVPPAVIACTLRPTYFLPRTSPLRGAVEDGGVLGRLRLRFPRLPEGLTEQSRWDVTTNGKGKTKTTSILEGDPYDHVYETEVQTPIDGRMPPYCGPGRLMLWYVADLQQQTSLNYKRLEGGDDLRIWADALAQTTINLLDAEFGIKAWADETYTALWVRRKGANGDEGPERQIAAIWPHIDEKSSIVSAGITLNVGLPREEQISTEEEGGGSGERKEANDEPDDTTTSIAAELASRPAGFNPKHRLKSDAVRLGKTMPVREIGAPASADPAGALVWYTRASEEGVGAETVAPLGMDNYSISVAWSHELTRVLGYRNALVDHHRDGGWTTRKVTPAGDKRLPMRPRIFATKERSDASESRNKEEEIITFNLGDIDDKSADILLEDAGAPPKRIANFERTLYRLVANLKQSVGANKLDTRNVDGYKEKAFKSQQKSQNKRITGS
ncbi:hypothetical protein PG988_013266 [Apiospora saccharicola]